VAIIPARPRHPRDQAKVETAGPIVERHVLAPLRHRTFFSLEALMRPSGRQLDALNARPFQKRPGSRQTLFETLDRPALRPFPPTLHYPLPAEVCQAGEAALATGMATATHRRVGAKRARALWAAATTSIGVPQGAAGARYQIQAYLTA
jgi:hypothetical protein